ncbi:MAG: hypothetical protein MRZ79_18430 [Bacteroidia bacterium]|nr:hypothetical protein [Bacteroidia bacterium]
MVNTRLVKILKSLSPSEIRNFVNYVSSPYLNQNKRLEALAKYLQQIYPSFKSSTFEKDYLFKLMFPGEKFSDQKVHDQMSALLRLLEEFLAHSEWKNSPRERSVHLLVALHKRGFQDQFYRVMQKEEKELSKSNFRNSDHYYSSYKLAHVSDPILSRIKPKEVSDNLNSISFNLETFYLAEKLRISCEMLNRKRILNIEVDTSRADELGEYLNDRGHSFLKEPLVAIYYQIFLTLKETDNKENYEKLVLLLDRYSHLFHSWQAYSMYVYALNYCVKNINQGKAGFREEMFMLFETLLEKDLLLEEGILSHSHYKNITNVGLSLKKYDWVKNFLEEYKLKLAPELRENAYTYNLSVFFYNQKKYKEARVLLQQIEFSDVFYHLSAKSLLMRIYYEVGDDDGFKYLVHAFQAFLKRNQKIPKYQIQSHHNFIKSLKKLVALRARKGIIGQDIFEERWEKLKASVLGISPMTHTRWLNEQLLKLNELKTRQGS